MTTEKGTGLLKYPGNYAWVQRALRKTLVSAKREIIPALVLPWRCSRRVQQG